MNNTTPSQPVNEAGDIHAVLPAEDHPVNILIVDDEASNLMALEAVLDDPGYRLVRARSGEEALLALVEGDFACLLLDVQMPGMTGFELARRIGERRRNAHAPIIFLTAHCQEDQHALEGYASGAADYLHKPLNPAVLRQKVEVFADLHRATRLQQLRSEARGAAIVRENTRLHTAMAEAERRKHRFLAMLAHELRNPLAPISNAAHIIRGQAAPESPMRWASDVIGRQAGRLARLIDDLLEVGRLVQGKVTMNRMPVTLATLVEGAVHACAPQSLERKQSILLELPAHAIEVEADASRLVQALANLVDNASKFSASGSTIHVTASPAASEVCISIQDAGTGIAPEFLPHIFEAFEQGEQALDRPQGGLGVGLTFTKLVVGLHGGRIEAFSGGPGQGTEMRVHLPARPAAEVEQRNEAPAPIATTAPPQPRAVRARVLVVDDETASAETLMALLEAEGFEVRIAHDGLAALGAAEAFLPQAILLDIGLPGMNGFEVAQHLRRQPQLNAALLIALTGYDDAESRSRSQQAGFDFHMTKPADLDRLLQMLFAPPGVATAWGRAG